MSDTPNVLLLAGPRGSGIAAGGVPHEVVELGDVMPTLLDCAGLPAPDEVEGRSFLPLARGERPARRTHLHGEHTLFGQSFQRLTDGHEKYVWHSGSGCEQLFHLDADPYELHDVAAEPTSSERITVWRKTLLDELSGREEGFVDGDRLVSGRPVQSTLAHSRERTSGLP